MNLITKKENLYNNDDGSDIGKNSCLDAVDKIYAKSSDIKARLMYKYLIYKLERNFRNKKFCRFKSVI